MGQGHSTPVTFLAALEGADHGTVAAAIAKKPSLAKQALKPGSIKPVHIAAEAGDLLMVQTIVTAYQQAVIAKSSKTHQTSRRFLRLIDQRTKSGMTPLHFAAKRNQLEVAEYLLEQGADPWAYDGADSVSVGLSAMHFAAKAGHKRILEALVTYMDAHPEIRHPHNPTLRIVNVKTGSGYTPSHFACHYRQVAVLEYLLQKGAAVSPRSWFARHMDLPYPACSSALHVAAAKGSQPCIRLLLVNYAERQAAHLAANGPDSPYEPADPRGLFDAEHRTPFAVAVAHHRWSSLELLNPATPLSEITLAEGSAARVLGPAKLKDLAAQALHNVLLSNLDTLTCSLLGKANPATAAATAEVPAEGDSHSSKATNRGTAVVPPSGLSGGATAAGTTLATAAAGSMAVHAQQQGGADASRTPAVGSASAREVACRTISPALNMSAAATSAALASTESPSTPQTLDRQRIGSSNFAPEHLTITTMTDRMISPFAMAAPQIPSPVQQLQHMQPAPPQQPPSTQQPLRQVLGCSSRSGLSLIAHSPSFRAASGLSGMAGTPTSSSVAPSPFLQVQGEISELLQGAMVGRRATAALQQQLSLALQSQQQPTAAAPNHSNSPAFQPTLQHATSGIHPMQGGEARQRISGTFIALPSAGAEAAAPLSSILGTAERLHAHEEDEEEIQRQLLQQQQALLLQLQQQRSSDDSDTVSEHSPSSDGEEGDAGGRGAKVRRSRHTPGTSGATSSDDERQRRSTVRMPNGNGEASGSGGSSQFSSNDGTCRHHDVADVANAALGFTVGSARRAPLNPTEVYVQRLASLRTPEGSSNNLAQHVRTPTRFGGNAALFGALQVGGGRPHSFSPSAPNGHPSHLLRPSMAALGMGVGVDTASVGHGAASAGAVETTAPATAACSTTVASAAAVVASGAATGPGLQTSCNVSELTRVSTQGHLPNGNRSPLPLATSNRPGSITGGQGGTAPTGIGLTRGMSRGSQGFSLRNAASLRTHLYTAALEANGCGGAGAMEAVHTLRDNDLAGTMDQCRVHRLIRGVSGRTPLQPLGSLLQPATASGHSFVSLSAIANGHPGSFTSINQPQHSAPHPDPTGSIGSTAPPALPPAASLPRQASASLVSVSMTAPPPITSGIAAGGEVVADAVAAALQQGAAPVLASSSLRRNNSLFSSSVHGGGGPVLAQSGGSFMCGASSVGGMEHSAHDEGEEGDDELCMVCLEELNPSNKLGITTCRHTLCIECAYELVRLHEVKPAPCPMCRVIIGGFTCAN